MDRPAACFGKATDLLSQIVDLVLVGHLAFLHLRDQFGRVLE